MVCCFAVDLHTLSLPFSFIFFLVIKEDLLHQWLCEFV